MKRSAMVKLGLTSAMAAALTGCAGRKEVSRCVDEHDRVVEDRLCGEPEHAQRSGIGPMFVPYHWYYGGTGFALGALAGGGRYTSTPGGTVVRSGFGSTGAGTGAGE